MKPLIVYKASAGSGKTFTLATEYIKLLVDNPQSYRQTLAVTFTNKATEEMKMRILSQLYGIWKRLPESQGYAHKVEKELQATPEFVSERAGQALQNLLHNYSYFRVETIDSFFQSVLRNLARELELTANLRVGLNDYQVEEMAVDQLIDELTPTDPVLQWLLRYIMDTIGDDRSWNVIGQIKHFGQTIFRDFYKQQRHELAHVFADPDFFERYTDRLKDVRMHARERMKEIAESFFSELEAEGFTLDDLSYGRTGMASFFLKMRDGVFDESIVGKRVLDCLGQPERWYKKSHPRGAELYHLAETTLGDILRFAIEERPRQWQLYQSAELCLRHLSQLRLLGNIEKRVRLLNEDANRFLLSDTQHLLHELIEGSDSPFIFEKIGTQLEHIMIDEFQDTSTVQWKNFKVLLEETMSHEGTENLIVGDVKQSIYRWRSGDWRLLANIQEEFADASERLVVKALTDNYRSARRVVDFNNAFFTHAAAEEDVSAYDDVVQHVPEGKPDEGWVSVVLLPQTDYQTATLQRLTDDIMALIAGGTAASDIAILVRTNSYIPLIANYFSEQMPDVPVVSDEAFRLDASPAVTTVIQALRYLTHPDDAIARAYLCKTASGELDGALPDGFTPDLLHLPLYELTERIFQLFSLDEMEGQSAYLCAFYDQIATFVNDSTTDVTTFLREWDETICSKTIQSPALDGIRLISIHKSKGLEFAHVYIPFCDWRMEHSDVLWCQPREAPFSDLPIVPVDYSQKGMKGTIFEADYDEEHGQTTVDNLNLLYVAFTRASRSLHVYGKRGGRSSRSALLEVVLPQVAGDLNSIITGETDDAAPLEFEYGQPSHETKASKSGIQPSRNPFLATAEPREATIQTYAQKVEFKQSNKSRDFANPDADDDQLRQTNYIQLGSVLHEVFSTISTTADIEHALQRLELEGIIYDADITRPRIEDMIRKRLSDQRVSDWFSERWTLYNECTILNVAPESGRVYERRPDRVMSDGEETVVVDFKFGRERGEYHDQVREYMSLLEDMSFPHVRGFLWFVYSNKIIEVK
ncbi:MAG: UvrD-helicase domain-containing protein [Prevotella sp.]|nr:UvrD-helicase domain-containing protein [Prevotella sp.]